MQRYSFDDLKDPGPDGAIFTHGVRVRFQDVDAAGIVYFARVFDYLHACYEAFLDHVGLPLAVVLEKKEWAAPLRHAEADYRAPLRFGDVLEVQLARIAEGPSELTLGFRILLADGRLAATGCTVHTFVDPKTFKRSAVPEAILAVLRQS